MLAVSTILVLFSTTTFAALVPPAEIIVDIQPVIKLAQSSTVDAYHTSYAHLIIIKQQEGKKEVLTIIDAEKIAKTKALFCIPYLGIRKYSEHYRDAHENLLMLNVKAIGSITYYYTFSHCYKSAHILGIGIKENRQRKGYGTYLIQKTLDQMTLDGIQEVNLQSRTEAIPFHKKFGFEKYGPKGYMQRKMTCKTITL
jgi:GNAT superfamily N-acetyltransferase